MNKFKLVLWIIILGIIALVIFQNQAFFLGSQSLGINLWAVPMVQTPPIPIAVILLIFFVFGLLLAFLFGIPVRFRNRKAIKRLNAANATQKDEIANLKKEIAALKEAAATAAGENTQLAAADGEFDGSAEAPNRQTDASDNYPAP